MEGVQVLPRLRCTKNSFLLYSEDQQPELTLSQMVCKPCCAAWAYSHSVPSSAKPNADESIPSRAELTMMQAAPTAAQGSSARHRAITINSATQKVWPLPLRVLWEQVAPGKRQEKAISWTTESFLPFLLHQTGATMGREVITED